jgi:hypothetical protein
VAPEAEGATCVRIGIQTLMLSTGSAHGSAAKLEGANDTHAFSGDAWTEGVEEVLKLMSRSP